ncbi:MAG: hypothetical protein APF77_03440 [Clostridia bacterium BRH_c25]|nr:MAG: hypothetical protein APF77_03440 [Clostridia bacterium BRH_c25]
MNLLKIFILELQAEIIVSPAGRAVKKNEKKIGWYRERLFAPVLGQRVFFILLKFKNLEE